jgi:hypothetical protein
MMVTGRSISTIRALLDFAGDKKLIQPGRIGQGSWFSSMDGVILEGIHDGFALSRGKDDAMYRDVERGAEAWQRFFEARRTDPGDTDLARSLWGAAEQTTTDFAHDLVGEGSEREEVFLENSNAWRKTLRASYSAKSLDFCEWGWCEPAIYLLDPRSYGEVRVGADLMWREAGFEAWLPDWLTD